MFDPTDMEEMLRGICCAPGTFRRNHQRIARVELWPWSIATPLGHGVPPFFVVNRARPLRLQQGWSLNQTFKRLNLRFRFIRSRALSAARAKQSAAAARNSCRAGQMPQASVQSRRNPVPDRWLPRRCRAVPRHRFRRRGSGRFAQRASRTDKSCPSFADSKTVELVKTLKNSPRAAPARPRPSAMRRLRARLFTKPLCSQTRDRVV